MTTRERNHIDEWLNKAFQLAFFLHEDRETAKKIALGAMAKLETASNAQFKRNYYTPVGRTETARATRSRVSLNDLQLLQRLVFVESENFEREHERSKKVCAKKLLTYFIKHLVRISLKRNSFYVTLGVTRILHNYGTADAMEIYNVVVQDPERVHDDYYYRSRKGVLMKELKTRFGERLDIARGVRGEERFQTEDENAGLTDLAKESLKIFMPWNSKCAIPEKFNPLDDVIKPFHFDKDDPDAEHRIEINRIHAALHPECFNRLTDALDLPAPEEKMEIPKFMINEQNADFDDNDWRNPPNLETDELETIKIALNAQAEKRKAMTAGFLRVVVDGAEHARIDLTEASAAKFELDESSELIEVLAADGSGEIVLATHLLNFEELARGVNTQAVTLEGGQKITFNFAPTIDRYGEVTNLKCGVSYAETAWRKRFAFLLRRARPAFGQSNRLLKPALTFGLILVALTFGWLIFQKSGVDNQRIAKSPNQDNRNSETTIPQIEPKQENSNTETENAPEIKNNINKPASKENEKPEIKKPAPKREIKREFLPEREIPVQKEQNQQLATNNKPGKDDIDENGVLKLPIRDNNNSPKNYPERRETRKPDSLSRMALGEIKVIYIEITGDSVLGEKIREQIAADVQKSGAFVVTNDKESADAALKIYVRHESDADTREEASVAAIVRLVNAKGFVVYPNQKRVSGWKYIGTIAKLPSRIAGDLIKAKNER